MSITLAFLVPLAIASQSPTASPASHAAQPAAHASPAAIVRVQAPAPAKPAPPAQKPVANRAPNPAPATTPATTQVRAQAPSPVTATPASPGFDRAAVLKRVETALSSVKTAEGRFVQIDGYGSSTGRFYIQRPGRVRFDYATPEPMHIVSDGVSISIHEPKRGAWDAVPLSTTPLNLFLRSNIDFRRDANVSKIERDRGSWYVTLEDRSGEAQGQMILEFLESDFSLQGWKAVDGGGDLTHVVLSDVKTNGKLKTGLFVVKDPSNRDDQRR
jgi:outer membrane lipoprotein-sorting protein